MAISLAELNYRAAERARPLAPIHGIKVCFTGFCSSQCSIDVEGTLFTVGHEVTASEPVRLSGVEVSLTDDREKALWYVEQALTAAYERLKAKIEAVCPPGGQEEN